jgi:hypothetical protein
MQERGRAWCYKEAVDLNPIRMKEHAMLLEGAPKEPPVGFEPTTSRLLSGCSAN